MVKKYPTYKDSGIPWIGTIPEGWSIRKIKHCNNVFTGNSISDDVKDKYTVNQNAIPYIATKDIDADTNKINYDNGLYIPLGDESFKVAPANSSLLCVEGGSAGKKIGFTDRKVCFVNKLCCFNSKDGSNSKFMYYVLQSDAFLTDFNLNMTGLIGGVSQGPIKNILIVAPSVTEQQAIVDYLDKKCAAIDETIDTEEKVIEELKEYKQSIITEAVTKGLDKAAPMKDSGIPWIGQIPQHWKRTKLKRLLSVPITDGPHETPQLLDSGIPFISAEAVKNNKINFDLMRGYISLEEHKRFCKKCKPQRNDIFMIKSGATTGNVALVETDEEFSIWSPLALMRANKNILHYKYLFHYIQSYNFRQQVELFWSYGTQQNIGMEVLGNLYVAYPIAINEQQAIADYLDNKCSRIDKAISDKKQVIEKLTEYKKSLIYECVTGKRMVA